VIERDGKHLTMFAIYDHPRDFPAGFIVRAWRVCCHDGQSTEPDGSSLALAALSLEQARAMLPPGLFRLDRTTDDDPTLIEVWL